MKKLVLFATIFAAVAFTACSNAKEEAPEATTTEEAAPVQEAPAQEVAPVDTAAAPAATPAQ